jgi:hypothetical protein
MAPVRTITNRLADSIFEHACAEFYSICLSLEQMPALNVEF